MIRRVTFADEARKKLKAGIDLISNSIKVTLGPKGRNVIYGFHYGFPVSTKDGVTVARQVDCVDQTEQLGLLLIRQAAQKTADDAGEGTTTVTLLAQAIFNEGLKALGTGANPILIKRAIDHYVNEIIVYLHNYVKREVSDEELLRVATISANNDSVLGGLVCDAVKKAGENGVITIEDNYLGSETYIHTIEGMQLNEGYFSPWFVTDREKAEARYQNPYILIADYEINHPVYIAKILEEVITKEHRPLVIICNQLTGHALGALVESKNRNGVPVLCCKSPYFGDNRLEQLTDLAILTGGQVASASTGLKLEDMKLSDLGQCDTIVATKYHTTFTGGKGGKDLVDARIKVIQETIDKSQSDYEKEKFGERLAKLTSGVAVIKVGAATEVDLKDKKFRIEDALCAVKAAVEEGIIVGGGVAFLRATQMLKKLVGLSIEEDIAIRIMIRALESPIKQIAENAGLDGSEIMARILLTKEFAFGYNFLTDEEGNLFEMGILDPFKVVRLSLENAASVAGMLLTTEVIINEEEPLEIASTPKGRSE